MLFAFMYVGLEDTQYKSMDNGHLYVSQFGISKRDYDDTYQYLLILQEVWEGGELEWEEWYLLFSTIWDLGEAVCAG